MKTKYLAAIAFAGTIILISASCNKDKDLLSDNMSTDTTDISKGVPNPGGNNNILAINENELIGFTSSGGSDEHQYPTFGSIFRYDPNTNTIKTIQGFSPLSECNPYSRVIEYINY